MAPRWVINLLDILKAFVVVVVAPSYLAGCSSLAHE